MKQLRALCLALILALVVGLLPIAAPARAEGELPYWIGVDVVNQRVTVYSTADNSVVHRWLCSTGKSATPTPTGTYTIPASHNTRKEWYKFGGVYVKWATRVTGGIYFHSVLFSKRSDNSLQTNTLKLLGHTASHGCIRMEVPNAKWISDNIAAGTTVIMHKGVDDGRITGVLGGSAGLAVTPSMPMPPTVQALQLDQVGPIILGKGESLQLNCAVIPGDATTSLTWRSSSSKRVTVSNTGLVTAVGDGTATVSVTASNGVKASLKVQSVDPTAARSVALDRKGTIYVNVGEAIQLFATVAPATAATALTWKTSKPKYAVVDGNGIVTGIAKGSSKITVLTSNKKKASVTVKVLDPYAPARVLLVEKGTITLHVGEAVQLNAYLLPETSRTTFTWLTNKGRVAVVDGNGLVTAIQKGTAKITVRTGNKKKASVKIKVID